MICSVVHTTMAVEVSALEGCCSIYRRRHLWHCVVFQRIFRRMYERLAKREIEEEEEEEQENTNFESSLLSALADLIGGGSHGPVSSHLSRTRIFSSLTFNSNVLIKFFCLTIVCLRWKCGGGGSSSGGGWRCEDLIIHRNSTTTWTPLNTNFFFLLLFQWIHRRPLFPPSTPPQPTPPSSMAPLRLFQQEELELEVTVLPPVTWAPCPAWRTSPTASWCSASSAPSSAPPSSSARC